MLSLKQGTVVGGEEGFEVEKGEELFSDSD
jgi:hypothetical protein